MTSAAPSPESKRINRFRLLRPLGYGAQGVVYVAYDPQLDRQVAIKTLVLGRHDPQQAQMLFAGARCASGLSHPNIVPVFEVGMHEGQPFVVFEYVEGRTLAAMLQAEGALPMAQAVVLMSQILAGMAHVHASGLLHGDIKPANILIGANGIPRVTDFGISRRALAAAGEAVSSGTVQYMAPECLSEGRADYRSDVFALGLMFHEMLTGTAATAGSNEYAQIYRILNETPQAPSVLNPRIDRRLDGIVLKALRRDPDQRYADAADMKLDLDRFRVPTAAAGMQLEEHAVHSTVEFLLRRMSLKSDFPALSASLNRINQLCAHADQGSLKAIGDLVMRDFALTQKVLRLVNAAGFGAGKVTRVSQAVALLGLSRLRSMATALMLANGGRSGPGCPAVAAALTDAFVAGVIARNIGRMAGVDALEELFICGMFSRLGQLLTLYYLSDEHEAIVRKIADERIDSARASRAVLGLTFDQFGAAVAQQWNFPEAIVSAMQPLPARALGKPGGALERMWHCAGYARELCSLAREAPADQRERMFAAHRARFRGTLEVDASQVRGLIAHSVEAASKYGAAASKYGAAAELVHAQTALLEGLRALAEAPAEDAAAASCSERLTAVALAPVAARAAAGEGAETSGDTLVLPERPQDATMLARAWRALF
jgi:eukaryotic-like serine/threonine-protein kinase